MLITVAGALIWVAAEFHICTVKQVGVPVEILEVYVIFFRLDKHIINLVKKVHELFRQFL